jgi:hypothetical protein
MQINRTRVVLALALILMTGALAFKADAQGKQQSSKTKKVQLFFPKEGDSSDPRNNPSNLQPVERTVNAAAPLRPTIEELLKGPTPQEVRRGYSQLDVGGMSIVKVAVKNGTAYAGFIHRKWAGWSGDISPLAFGDAVERTLKQFPGVTRTVVCVDGVTNYADESGGPEKKCPKF